MKIELKGNTSQEGTPTPETPQDIHVVSGDNTIKVENKNLFDKNNINGLSVYLDTTNNKLVSNNNNKSIYISCKPNTTYTISKTPSKRFEVAYTYTTPENNTAIYGTITNYDGASITITTDTNAQYLVVWLINSNISGEISYQTAIDTLQIEYGNQATPYEAYKSASYPISLGVENLFTGFISGYVANNGSTIIPRNNYLCTDKISVKPTVTYTFSNLKLSNDYAGNGYKHIIEYDSNDTFVARTFVGNYSSTSSTFTTNENTSYIRYAIFSQFISSENCTYYQNNNNVQLVEGSTSQRTSSNPIELCKIGDYQDTIVKDNGKWYLYKEIGKVVLKTTGWTINNACFQTQTIYPTDVGNVSSGAYINQYKYNSIHEGITNVLSNNEFGWNTASKLTIKDTKYSTASDFMTALKNEKPILYYVLATPTYTEITDSTLISQLEALKKAINYDEQTNISQENNDLPFILNVSALKKNSSN